MFLLVLFNLRRIDDLVTIQIGSERKKILCRDDVGCTLFRDSNKVANAVKTSCTCQKSGISITLLSGGFLISRVDKSTLANYENRFHSNKITTNTIGEMIQAKINYRTSSGSLFIIASRGWIITERNIVLQVKPAPAAPSQLI